MVQEFKSVGGCGRVLGGKSVSFVLAVLWSLMAVLFYFVFLGYDLLAPLNFLCSHSECSGMHGGRQVNQLIGKLYSHTTEPEMKNT